MSLMKMVIGYFRAPKKLESKDEVIARVCAGLELYYQQKESGTLPKDERTPEQIQDAQDDYWIEKLTRKREAQLWHDNFMASFSPGWATVGPKQPTFNSDIYRDTYGRLGAVKSN
ncbi:hypothetical protein [Enterobacter cloacae]|uniref:Uncharacterized protein n=2 Tax=Enterobacter cloacae TaxID=550 RepID=A0A0H3CNI8_ENTCC|nr:hypothetical protein [Enterobacter cloacae]ADF63134.1 hypothetical protein ECL_03600 [Enterobacter cloacae subsp. cloacae ATCC 13047]KGB11878.1 hypothetical protein DR74_3648 [Enterobacter cloacae]MDK9961767.1 hypothetical protein [Enterobacter cloacae]OOC90507.1 hypothetical protein BWP06_07440 [Enterobacter cloacae]QLA63892.1 hypothetical protein HWQ16_16595 [Enterobacter cloacae]